MNLYRRVAGYYRPYLPTIGAALVLLLLTVGLNLLKPWPVKWLIDEIIPRAIEGRELQTFLTAEPVLGACLAVVVISLLAGALGVANNYLLVKVGLKALLRLRTQLYSYLQHLPLHFHDRRRSGDSTFRVAYDSQAIQTFFNRGFATIIGSIITLIGTFLIMLRMDVALAFLAFAVVPFLWGAIYFFADRVRRQTTALQQEESDVLARASEGLTSIRIVHAFGREEFEVKEFEREARQSLDANLQLTITNVMSTLVVGTIMAIGTALILYFGVQHVIEGKLKIGDLWVYLSYLAALYQPLEQLSYTAWALEGAAAGAQRVFEILDEEDSVPEKPGAIKMPPIQGRVEFQDVEFSYEPGVPILRGLSLSVEPGKAVALVGGTGAGKTTLLSLATRFYDPDAGTVRIDGIDLRDVTKKSLREQIAVVLQDTLLLSGTVRENIAYGRVGATKKEIEEAAHEAQAHEFILKLPKGYDTPVGERGVRLSGGQKQRIGIARAFLKQAPLLLLDEPTSALDLETEAEIMETLRTLIRRQTTLIVTHRLSTIHHLDCIYVLEQGRLAEQGKGPELAARGGVYARLWAAGNG
jgi:ABC-type multidrug transport system fused ATPase/permease subunit